MRDDYGQCPVPGCPGKLKLGHKSGPSGIILGLNEEKGDVVYCELCWYDALVSESQAGENSGERREDHGG